MAQKLLQKIQELEADPRLKDVLTQIALMLMTSDSGIARLEEEHRDASVRELGGTVPGKAAITGKSRMSNIRFMDKY